MGSPAIPLDEPPRLLPEIPGQIQDFSDDERDYCMIQKDGRPTPIVGKQMVPNLIRRVNDSDEIAVEDVNAFSSHSEKRAIATELAFSGTDYEEIQRVTGHKALSRVKEYIDAAQLVLSELARTSMRLNEKP